MCIRDRPEAVLAGFEDPLKAGLEHEQYVTSLIHAIYDAAYAQKDFRTMQFLDWFVKEQGEEEKNADDLITKFNLFGHDSRSLYMLDSELAARVYSAPVSYTHLDVYKRQVLLHYSHHSYSLSLIPMLVSLLSQASHIYRSRSHPPYKPHQQQPPCLG